METTGARPGRRRRGFEPVIALVVGIIVVLAIVWLIASGVIYKVVPNLKAPGSVFLEMRKDYLVGSCKGWVDSLGLAASLPEDLAAAIKVNNLHWESFCSKEAIKDPQNKCRCLKACVKSLDAEEACAANPNAYHPGLWTPGADGKTGNISSLMGSFDNVEARMAPTYCFLNFLKSLSTVSPSCASESSGGYLVMAGFTVAYKTPKSAGQIATYTDSGGAVDVPEIRELTASCTVQCRNPEGCDNVVLSLMYKCNKFNGRGAPWLGDGGHCCDRIAYSYLGDGNCFAGRNCGTDPFYQGPVWDVYSVPGWRKAYETMRTSTPAVALPHINSGKSYTQDFTLYTPQWDVVTPFYANGINDLEENNVMCAASYAGDRLNSVAQTVLVGSVRVNSGIQPDGTERKLMCLPGTSDCQDIFSRYYDLDAERQVACS